MTAIWGGEIGKLKEIISSSRLESILRTNFENFYKKPSIAEINSWVESIPELVCKVLNDSKFNNIQVLIEFQMPIGAERADIVLIGGSKENIRTIIIELKQWEGISFITETNEINVPGLGSRIHPSLQCLNYLGKLKFFNSRAHNYEMKAAVFLHNGSSFDKEVLLNSVDTREWNLDAPIFVSSEYQLLSDYIFDFLIKDHNEINCDEYELLNNAPYDQSRHLFFFLQEHATEIAKNSEKALAFSGLGLTEEQEKIKNEVILSLANKQKATFIIDGGPGSGKTLLAVSLLLNATERGKSCVLALRNNRLQAILKQIFDKEYPGASGLMMYFEPRQGRGIAKFDGYTNLVICDEAQRMEKRIMPSSLSKGDINVIFLDESQRLNPPEQGTIINFVESNSLAHDGENRSVTVKKLSQSIRCHGGQLYYSWIEQFLLTPKVIIKNQDWKSHYQFMFFENLEDLIRELKKLADEKTRVALCASFTESPGASGDPFQLDNMRIGYPLKSGFDLYKESNLMIPWLMSPTDYRSFWINCKSNRLDRVASIYGTQGFESDYVGVVWGRDLVIRNSEWVLGNPDFCFDRIDGLVTGSFGKRKWNQDALQLVKNRYRIFLTRGIKGTFIYCEDKETRDFLTKNYQ